MDGQKNGCAINSDLKKAPEVMEAYTELEDLIDNLGSRQELLFTRLHTITRQSPVDPCGSVGTPLGSCDFATKIYMTKERVQKMIDATNNQIELLQI